MTITLPDEPELPLNIPPTNTIDELMSRDPTNLSSIDIDEIIRWHQVQRTRRASGEKLVKPKVDISATMNKLLTKVTPAPDPTFKRRV